MNNDDINTSSSNLSFVTMALVVVSSILRVIVGDSNSSTKTVSVLNIIMMGYVLYRIISCVYTTAVNNSIKDNVGKNQIKACKNLRIIVCVAFFIASAIYICCQFLITNDSLFCIINDIIALVAFGVSIEEETIESVLIKYFKSKVFM